MEDKRAEIEEITDGTLPGENEETRRGIFKYVPLCAIVFFCIGLISLCLYISFILYTPFADFFNESISPSFRFVLAKLTYIFPFSVAESIVFAAPAAIFLILRAVFKYMDRERHGFSRSLTMILSVGALLFSVFVFTFAAGYRSTPLNEKLGFEVGEVTVEELEETAYYLVDRVNAASREISFTEEGTSVRMYTHAETVELALESYEVLSESCGFITNFDAPVKRLASSPLMTYTHISGMYTFFTGEANLNTNYPEFVNVYTIAHEMAHQRGISRENEANFVAYLVCIGSSDSYMQYSGYLNMLEYFLSAVSTDTAKKLYAALDSDVLSELREYSKFFDKYRESAAAEVSGTVNNAYLQIQGTPGTKSYGMVVDLAVAYHKGDITD